MTSAVAKTVIKVADLKSRHIAASIAPRGKKIDTSGLRAGGNIFQQFVGFFTERIGSFIKSINFKKIWGWIVSAFHYLWTFDWQQTDEELDKQIAAMWLRVEERMFGLIGRSMGYLLCGAVPGAAIATFNMPMAAYLMYKLGDEAVEDMLDEINSFFQLAGRAALQSMFLKAFQSVRKLVKWANKVPGVRQFLNKVGIDNKKIDEWGEDKNKSWSFSKALNDRIEKIPSERLQNNIEEFIDEFSDACIESGYVLASGLDEYLGLDGVNQGVFDLFGSEREVAYQPNKEVPGEQFLLRGKTEFIKNQMTTLANTSQLVGNRDIGLILPSGSQFDENPPTKNNGIEVTFEFFNYEQPPYYTKDRRNKLIKGRLTVPNCEKIQLTWENIHTVFSGSSASTRKVAYKKGNKRCEGFLENGRKLICYTDDDSEGEKLLLKLASFTKYNLVYPIDIRYHKGWEKRRGYNLTTIGTRMYLGSIVICNWEKITKFEAFKNISKKAFRKDQSIKLTVHENTKPTWWDETLKEALRDTITD